MDEAFAEKQWGTTLLGAAARGGMAHVKDDPPRLSAIRGVEAR